MSSFEYLRQQALKLPEVEAGLHRGGPAFRVRGKTFALWWVEGARTILKLRREHQILLFEVRPAIFQPCQVGVGTWSFVQLALLEDAELASLVVEAWSTVAPRALSQRILGR